MNDKLKHFIAGALIAIAISANAQITGPIPFDKKWHIGAGTVASAWGTFAGNSLELSPEESALFGVATGFVAGIGKECIDVAPQIFGRKDARFDPMDVAATTMGGVIGAGLSYAALKIFKKPPVIYAGVNKGFEIGIKIRL